MPCYYCAGWSSFSQSPGVRQRLSLLAQLLSHCINGRESSLKSLSQSLEKTHSIKSPTGPIHSSDTWPVTKTSEREGTQLRGYTAEYENVQYSMYSTLIDKKNLPESEWEAWDCMNAWAESRAARWMELLRWNDRTGLSFWQLVLCVTNNPGIKQLSANTNQMKGNWNCFQIEETKRGLFDLRSAEIIHHITVWLLPSYRIV